VRVCTGLSKKLTPILFLGCPLFWSTLYVNITDDRTSYRVSCDTQYQLSTEILSVKCRCGRLILSLVYDSKMHVVPVLSCQPSINIISSMKCLTQSHQAKRVLIIVYLVINRFNYVVSADCCTDTGSASSSLSMNSPVKKITKNMKKRLKKKMKKVEEKKVESEKDQTSSVTSPAEDNQTECAATKCGGDVSNSMVFCNI